jgi:hypothetical protein
VEDERRALPRPSPFVPTDRAPPARAARGRPGVGRSGPLRPAGPRRFVAENPPIEPKIDQAHGISDPRARPPGPADRRLMPRDGAFRYSLVSLDLARRRPGRRRQCRRATARPGIRIRDGSPPGKRPCPGAGWGPRLWTSPIEGRSGDPRGTRRKREPVGRVPGASATPARGRLSKQDRAARDRRARECSRVDYGVATSPAMT